MAKNRILLVDDEPDIIETSAFMLSMRNYNVITASCGTEAIEKAKSEKPDLILLDIMMPDINGYDVCVKLRTDAATKDIPIIMLSAKGEGDAVMKCYKLGAEDYVVKPFNLPVLIEKMDKLLNR